MVEVGERREEVVRDRELVGLAEVVEVLAVNGGKLFFVEDTPIVLVAEVEQGGTVGEYLWVFKYLLYLEVAWKVSIKALGFRREACQGDTMAETLPE